MPGAKTFWRSLWRLLMARCNCTGQHNFMMVGDVLAAAMKDMQKCRSVHPLPSSGPGALIADNAGQDSWWEQRLAGTPWCEEGKGQTEHLGGACPPLPLPKAQPCLVGRLPVLGPGLAMP